jgi:AcrR family transcriptional regulator
MSMTRRGPVRSDEARCAILEATSALIAKLGYDKVTIEGIAGAAHVGKQTIYRWWPSKSAVVAECLVEGALLPESFLPADTGDIEADLADWLERVFSFLAAPEHAAMVLSLLAASVENAEVGLRLAERLGVSPTHLEGRLQVAFDAGQLASAASVSAINEALLGVIITRVMSRAPIAAGDGRTVVAGLLGGVRASVG